MLTLGQIIEEKAEKDGRYAIAYALLKLEPRLADLGFGRGVTSNGTTDSKVVYARLIARTLISPRNQSRTSAAG